MQRRNNGLESDDGNEERLLLNRLIATFGVQPNIHEAGQVVLIASDQTNPAACLLLMALEAMQFGVWRRFKVCREPTCRASYYDASKAAVKTWCSMETCGSRNKMRRYRTRRVEL